jgi:hypothetical protein
LDGKAWDLSVGLKAFSGILSRSSNALSFEGAESDPIQAEIAWFILELAGRLRTWKDNCAV